MSSRRLWWAAIALLLAASAYGQSEPSAAKPAGPAAKQLPQFGSKPQEILLTKITVTDLVKSYEFYTQVIGLKLVTTPDYPLAKAPTRNDPDKEHVEIPLNFSGSIADPIFLLVKQPGVTPSRELTKLVVVGLKVQDSAAVVKRATDGGYQPTRQIKVGPAQVSFIPDPDGYTLEIF